MPAICLPTSAPHTLFNITSQPIEVNITSHYRVTDANMELHWLPIGAQIQYKLCLLVHRALNYICL